MDINYIKIDNESKFKLNRNKLKDRLKSMVYTLQCELDKIEKEGDNYKPSNGLGIIGSEGSIIDVLISAISEQSELKQKLEDYCLDIKESKNIK
ncbi:hypothetical protein EJM73_08755 [Clostridium botulinum]|uniref:hypothetical protein n=1 Tax=Clostridium botulinum TaxID=1491 RepID=UPI00137648CF|nr:hypothetical protein [Clostridium botulinum]NCI19713.1 hypothetical protein [Clostridium botulinum]NCI35751.1 hypothetical protein [Clostridium botulinum]NCI71608.1 hypothetical protein [Clostridium botulinum]NDI38800.1 hypothetical protein [Clostridium botulinum]